MDLSYERYCALRKLLLIHRAWHPDEGMASPKMWYEAKRARRANVLNVMTARARRAGARLPDDIPDTTGDHW